MPKKDNMLEDKLVSVVVMTYNGEKYLKEQLDSILLQTYSNFEIIIVDDNSIDQSLVIANEIAAKDKRVRVYKNSINLGIERNFLKALSYLKGELVCFSDQDDYWCSKKIEVLVGAIERDKNNMLVFSDLEVCDSSLNIIEPSFWKSQQIKPRSGYTRELAFLKNIAPGCSMMFRNEVSNMLSKVATDAPFMHDHLAFILSAGLGKVVCCKQRLVKYRQHDSNAIGAFYPSIADENVIVRGLKNKIRFFREHPFKGVVLNLDKMDGFADSISNKSILKRARYLDCYIFLKDDTVSAQLLGITHCLFPALYRRLKAMKGALSVGKYYRFILRLFFIVWSLVVLKFFFTEFMLHKILLRLGA